VHEEDVPPNMIPILRLIFRSASQLYPTLSEFIHFCQLLVYISSD